MARIVDKDTRLIDVDFGNVFVTIERPADSHRPIFPPGYFGDGADQILNEMHVNPAGSFIQYQQVDLSFMTMNSEVMQPVEVSVQRTSPVPLGLHFNGNNEEQMEEFLFVFSRPLNNEQISSIPGNFNIETFRNLGLDTNRGSYGGDNAGYPSQAQTIYAEKRMYSYNTNHLASIANGALTSQVEYNTVYAMPQLDSVTTWGSLSAITGPSLHCYRVVIMRNQNFFLPGLYTNEAFEGTTSCSWPAVNLTFLCKDPSYTEGEYLTRLANAMNSIPEGGPTA